MKQEKDEAISAISVLIEERTRVRAHTAAQSGFDDQMVSLYRKVKLAYDYPDFLVKAARIVFRKEFHPGRPPADRRLDAEQRFKDAEAVFDEIRRLLGR